jgi:hypothetical protein
MIPRDLPPTTGPCPLCAAVITSPAEDLPVPPPSPAPAFPIYPEVSPANVQQPTSVDDIETNRTRAQRSAILDDGPRRSILPAVVILIALAAVLTGVIWFAVNESKKKAKIAPPNPATTALPVNEAHYLRIGWQTDAYRALKGFIAATTVKDKLPFILNASNLAPKIEEAYGGSYISDSDTPAESFTVYELSESDTKRGLFVMIYDQPARLEMKEFFRPLASLEVQYGLQEADLLLSTVANVGNFSTEPLRVLAFFKRTPEGLKLDWEIFTQTKYRTLRNFAELPEVGNTKIFRVLISEDVPEQGRTVPGTRAYRVVDPANTSDGARVNVQVDSDTGRALAPINWRGTKENQPVTQSATVELSWSGTSTTPTLNLTRLVCWEFMGLGGQESPTPPAPK